MKTEQSGQVERKGYETAIAVQGLKKSFGAVHAVAGVDFTVASGEIFGFLGPNGAGKTTTINMLTGLSRPDEGFITVRGINCTGKPKAAQHLMGIVPDESNLYPELSGYENLCFCGSLYGMRKGEREARARELLDQFGLAAAADRKFGGYSKGMKRKLTIAAGIIHNPPVLFLDEPTSGIDVASARQIRRLIADLNHAGTTIFLTTHYIEEAERLCSRIAFIAAGRIVRTDTVAELMKNLRNTHEMQFTVAGADGRLCAAGKLCAAMEKEFSGIRCTSSDPQKIRVESPDPVQVGPIVRFLEDAGAEVFEARRLQPTLEEVFVQITGIEATAMKQEQEKPKGGANA